MRIALIFALMVSLAACSTVPKHNNTSVDGGAQALPQQQANEDPWEGFNRQVYRFNDVLDRALLKPVAKGYKAVTPDPVESGVANVFDNLGEISTIVNSMLQWKWGSAAHSTGRFVVNSTLGVVGLIDVADRVGLEKRQAEDFGQTLATWGVNSGPYLVLPFFGPTTVRDGLSRGVDWYLDPVSHIEHDETGFALRGVRLVSDRSQLLQAEELISGDRYTFIRDAYLQNREFLINDGAVEDDFGEDDEFSDEEGLDDFDDIEF